MRSCSEVGIALLLCYQALAHVPAVSCCSSGSVSPGDHHAWLDSKPQRYTDTSVILTPLWHYRERNSVQRGANQGRETGSSMRHLQTRADPCNAQQPLTTLVMRLGQRFESARRLSFAGRSRKIFPTFVTSGLRSSPAPPESGFHRL